MTHEDLSISRIVDRRAEAHDWERLHVIAADDPEVWRRLAETLESEDALVRSLRAAVGAPATPAAATTAASRPRLAWHQWLPLAAASLLFAVSVWLHFTPRTADERATTGPEIAAGVPAALDGRDDPSTGDAADGLRPVALDEAPDALLQHYLEAGQADGRVLRTLPNVTLATRPAEDGDALEVIFVRRVVERALVRDAFRLAVDDAGQPTTVPIQPALLRRPSDF